MPLLTFTQTFTASGSWTAPDFLAALPAVYAWGPSGTAANGTAGTGGGGGGGGIGGEPALGGVAAGTVLTVTVGTGGSGTASTVTGGSVTVTGNAGGNASVGTGGAAGGASTNTVTFAGGGGGNGAAGGSGGGGGGGGSAGSTGAGGTGGNAVTVTGGSAGAAGTGAAGLAGAAGGAGGNNGLVGQPGNAPGGAPGGGSASHAAGATTAGQVIIIWQVWVPPQPVLSRRRPSRAAWAGPAHPGTVAPLPGQIQSSGSLIIRRVPGAAVWGGYAASGGGAAVLPGQIQSSGLLIIRRVTNTGGTWGGYAAVSNIPAPPVIPTGPPPVIPTSGGTINPWIRTWRAIAPGDVPASGAELPKIHGRGYVGVADGHVEDVIHEPTPVAGPTIIDLAADAAAAAARQLDEIKTTAFDIGRIFADPPYQPKQVKRCGVIRRVGGVLLTCGRRPGHVGKHSDRGLDWR